MKNTVAFSISSHPYHNFLPIQAADEFALPFSWPHRILVELMRANYSLKMIAGQTGIARKNLLRLLNHQTKNLRPHNFTRLLGFYCRTNLAA